MNFFEFQYYFEENSIMFDLVRTKMPSNLVSLKKNEKCILSDEHLYFIEKGVLLLKQNFYKGKARHTLLLEPGFIQSKTTSSIVSIHSLENTELLVFNIVDLFDQLEKEMILSNFVWYLAKQINLEFQNTYKIIKSANKKSILSILSYIKASIPEADEKIMPSWVNVKLLSLLCSCSVASAKSNLKALEDENIIQMKDGHIVMS
ncbi:hypothetical protein [Listeria rocourtiae]|uniref:hypothetical protein n=1 Tax=Listeria rocourtiae TaxID=647910 RepID=UPI003D2F6AC5